MIDYCANTNQATDISHPAIASKKTIYVFSHIKLGKTIETMRTLIEEILLFSHVA